MIGRYRDTIDPVAPVHYRYPVNPPPFNPQAPWAQWINHTTYLIQIQGKHLLTDPIWSERCSPLSFIGPRRSHAPALALKDLPQIDYVLISHDHYDHLDRKTVLKLHEQFPNILWIVPKGVRAWFKRQGIERVQELAWWEEIQIDSSFKVTSVPSQHFSGRFKMNKTLWCGYVVEALLASKRLYFVGDTGYNPKDFKSIGEKWKSFDLSLIPIGAYSPRAFMSAVHVDPKDAVNIHREVGSKLSLATHWKTFRLSDESINQPPFDLYLSLQKAGVHPAEFLAIEPGSKVNW